MTPLARIVSTVGVALGIALAAGAGARGEAQPTYEKDIRPLFTKYGCLDCHNPQKIRKSKYDGTTYQAALRSVRPGQPEESKLVKLLEVKKMPPRKASKPMTPEDLSVVKAWIAAGAPEK
jgi:hypothetical protein